MPRLALSLPRPATGLGGLRRLRCPCRGSRSPFRLMPADKASSRRAQNAVMNRVVPGKAADNGALEAAFGVGGAGARDDSDTHRSDFEESSYASHEKASETLEANP
jgi:hypothetical protein